MIWNLYALHCILVASMVLSFYTIVISTMDIIFLANYGDNVKDSTTFKTQRARIMVQIGDVVINVVFFIAGKKKLTKLVSGAMLICGTLFFFKRSMWLHNLYTRAEPPNLSILSPATEFELHPLMILMTGGYTAILFQARLAWFLEFCHNKQLYNYSESSTICGLRIRTLLFLSAILPIVFWSFLVWHRVRVFASPDIRRQLWFQDPWFIFVSGYSLCLMIFTCCSYIFYGAVALWERSKEKLETFHKLYLATFLLNTTTFMFITYQERSLHSNSLASKYFGATFLVLYFHFHYALLVIYIQILKMGPSMDQFVVVHKIKAKHLSVLDQVPIGAGVSSKVFQGTLKIRRFFISTKQLPVAIKVFPGTSDATITNLLMEELRNMSRLMANPVKSANLVTFLGACFQNPDIALVRPLGTINIVMALCEKGSLLDFIQNMKSTLPPSVGMEISHSHEQQLHQWVTEIAMGMEYIASQNMVHGDLAARNILLDGNLVAKISDFGMSSKLYNYQICLQSQQTVFPWRWMAPESLYKLEFSQKSDIWSFGVLVWELYTLGDRPWDDVDWTSNFISRLEQGERLKKPPLATEGVYREIMLSCWKQDAKERPAFTEMIKMLSQHR